MHELPQLMTTMQCPTPHFDRRRDETQHAFSKLRILVRVITLAGVDTGAITSRRKCGYYLLIVLKAHDRSEGLQEGYGDCWRQNKTHASGPCDEVYSTKCL